MSTQSFPKTNRLLSSKDFSAVFERAKYRIGCSEFLILAIDNNLSTSRLGLVVGKKNTRLSVGRNSIKRVFRESFRKIALALYDNECIDIVIITRPKVSKCSSIELSDQLSKIWPKLQVKVEKGKRND